MKHELMELASNLESLTVDLENLASLLQIYDEHREDELQGVSAEEPYTIIGLLARQNLGQALLDAIEAKAQDIKALWSQTRSTDALFLYGYQTGMEAAKKALLLSK